MEKEKIAFEKIDEYRWKIPQTGEMKVPGLVYADKKLLDEIKVDESPRQVAHVAYLPGIIRYSLAMPDIHWGYGFPIGGVAAFEMENGVISPGGVGYDINCGCRLLRTDLTFSEIRPRLKELLLTLYQHVPSGVGSTSKIKLSFEEEKRVLKEGARWAVQHGYGQEEDLERTEDSGVMQDADPEVVSNRALERGKNQLGTLGSGNHFLEVGMVVEVFNEMAASCFGLQKDQITVLIHSGSRGFGYQICDDFLKEMMKNLTIVLPDRQLACTLISSPLGRRYFSAMACAANYAWCNREVLSHWTREVFEKTLQISPKQLNLRLVYDVCHNIAKKEIHTVEGEAREVCVHRKGATRAFPAGHKDVPEIYRDIGQPVLIPGDMGRSSYVLVGTERAMEETFGSTCHGAGRLMSRAQAKKASRGRAIAKELEEKGILVMSADRGTLTEEIPEAYKDVGNVVEVVHQAGISKKVAKLKPLAVIKG